MVISFDPQLYFTQLLTKLTSAPDCDLSARLPVHWKFTAKQNPHTR
jgi:hypothetical protein